MPQINDNELLAKIAKTRLTTTFIGAISDIEIIFGELWNEPEDPEGSAEWRQAFEEIRKRILDRGNAQLRAFNEELSKFEVKWTGPVMLISKKEGR